MAPLSSPRAQDEAHRGHMSSEDTLSYTGSSAPCPENAADCQTHISCDRVYLHKEEQKKNAHQFQSLTTNFKSSHKMQHHAAQFITD